MSKVRCPICDAAMPGNWADYPEYPFCSRRCKTIDLGKWLSEDYRVPVEDDAAGVDDQPDPDPKRNVRH